MPVIKIYPAVKMMFPVCHVARHSLSDSCLRHGCLGMERLVCAAKNQAATGNQQPELMALSDRADCAVHQRYTVRMG